MAPTRRKDKGKEREVVPVEPEQTDFLSFNETVQFIVEFLEVAFNTILYLRQVYPSYVFTKAKKYETPVWKTRVPVLQSYLADAAKAVGEQLSQGCVKQVHLTIRSVRTHQFLETFVFDFSYLGVSRLFFASLTEKDTKIEGSPTRNQLAITLRSLLVKLSVTEGLLNGLPEDETTFDIGVNMQDDFDVDPTANDRIKGKPPLWLPGQMDEDRMVNVPLRTVNLGVISMQMLVQENVLKGGGQAKDGQPKLDKGKGKAFDF